jgi:hypothetical protein
MINPVWGYPIWIKAVVLGFIAMAQGRGLFQPWAVHHSIQALMHGFGIMSTSP